MSPDPATIPTRRTLAKGAAWSLPAVMVAVAAPAFAASQYPTVTGRVCQLFYGSGTTNVQTHSIFWGITSSSGVIPAGTIVSYKVCVTPPSTSDTWTIPTNEYPSGYSPTATNGPWYISYRNATDTGAISSGTMQTGPQCFTVRVTFNQAYTGSFCAASIWNDTFTLRPASAIDITENGVIAGPAITGGPGTLKYTAARRYPKSINSSGRTPHYYTSKSGVQSCYPAVQYAVELSNTGADNVTCYPSGTVVPTPCSWDGLGCSGTTGLCAPRSGGPQSGQYTQPAQC